MKNEVTTQFPNTKCIRAFVDVENHIHILHIKQDDTNTGMLASRVMRMQFEKIESALSKRYIKLPFGIRLLV